MGIQISLSRTKIATYQEVMLDRLKICLEAIKFFYKGIFLLQNAEVWFSAPSKALGGELARVVKEENPYVATQTLHEYLKEIPFEDSAKTIVIFRGIWEFNDTILGGYFSVQNNVEWRKVYGDIEISAYAKKDFEDLVDALWQTQDFSSIIPNFLRHLNRSTRESSLALSNVTFSRGIPTKEDPTNLMAVYLTGERRSLLGLFYSALRERKDRDVIIKAKPLATRFFINTLMEEEAVRERIDKRLQKALIDEIQSKSALYIARKQNSFATLFRELSQSVLKPALGKLPKEEIVKDWIHSGLEEYHEEE